MQKIKVTSNSLKGIAICRDELTITFATNVGILRYFICLFMYRLAISGCLCMCHFYVFQFMLQT